MGQEFEYDVFLSHSAKDKAVVRSLAEWLLRDGLRVWYDGWEFAKAQAAQRETESDRRPSAFGGRGLEYSRLLVLCMSVNAYGSAGAPSEAGTFQFGNPLPHSLRFDDVNGNNPENPNYGTRRGLSRGGTEN